MARQTASFRLLAKRDLEFCWPARLAKARNASDSAPQRPSSATFSESRRKNQFREGPGPAPPERSTPPTPRPPPSRAQKGKPAPRFPPCRCNRHPRAPPRTAAATAVTAFESSKDWCAIGAACSSSLDARRAAACPTLWQGKQQLDRVPFCRTPGVS